MTAEELFWHLAGELHATHPEVREGTIMKSRCLHVGKEFLALTGYKDAGLVVKLPKARVAELIEAGQGEPFGPGSKIFKEWVSIPEVDADLWRALLLEGVAFVG
ncbi:MAG: hypothetical protein ACE366_13710 [Bradymonadia bacterium]